MKKLSRVLILATVLHAVPGLASSLTTPWPVAKRQPTVALMDVDGKTWRDADLKGRVTLINFWASWCEPCRAEIPSLLHRAQTHPTGQLQVLMVNYQESEAKARQFVEMIEPKLPMNLFVLLDKNGSAAQAWTKKIFPTTVVLDHTGRARFTVTGEFDWQGAEAERFLAPLLLPRSRHCQTGDVGIKCVHTDLQP